MGTASNSVLYPVFIRRKAIHLKYWGHSSYIAGVRYYLCWMLLFYTEEISGERAVFSGQEALHIGKVLRMKPGDILHWTDGRGNRYSGTILDVSKRAVIAVTQQKISWEKPWNTDIHLAVCPTKNIQRTEWMIEKLCEIGVDSITPVVAQNSERRTIKIEKLQRKIISACTQSLKAKFPILYEAQSFQNYLSKHRGLPTSYILHCRTSLKHLAQIHPPATNAVHILIGPEGDFTKEEVADALEAGWIEAGLGLSRLRTETAAVMACHTIHIINAMR